jgi:hypothetical protein
MTRRSVALLLFPFFFSACDSDDSEGTMTVINVFAGSTEISLANPMTTGVSTNESITIFFSALPSQSSVTEAVSLKTESGQIVPSQINVLTQSNAVTIYPSGPLDNNTVYIIDIASTLQGANGERFSGQQIFFQTVLSDVTVVAVRIGGTDVTLLNRYTNVPLNLDIEIEFSQPLKTETVLNAISVTGPGAGSISALFSNNNKTVLITSNNSLKHLVKYELKILNTLKGFQGENFAGIAKTIYTTISTQPQQLLITDDELLTRVQQQTFKYFWDFAHPSSGMARERNSSGDIVTIGGSGFGIMALIVGMERNFITRDQGLQRMDKILDFLEIADRFHGAWPHWVNGTSGDVIPFSPNDNGGDLVETSFLVEGLITFRQYLDGAVPEENILINRINTLWKGVEWDWYTRGGQNVLYWHWSPDKEWIMNHQIKGYNECLITYVLAASSPTHTINVPVYTQGWASNGGIVNGRSFYNITLPLGFDYGGPLFFTHYSFLGLDPRTLQDQYANYWTQNVNHSLINHQHSVVNPKQFVGYSDENWGLTASDNHLGYSAHSPTNDLGVISPTAALSSFPYTPDQSMKALKFFYYKLGDRLWGDYGFYDAFNLTEGWTASSYLAIDQGPIVIMIENHRTGLLWSLFMSAPEVQDGLDKLSFTY